MYIGIRSDITLYTKEQVDKAIDLAYKSLLATSAAKEYSPNGSYVPGDYCTHGGKLHKCSTPIESGEPWNAAHWTETTVAAELANKLNTPTSLNANVDLNDVKTPGFYYCDGATGANRPINTGAFSLLVENTGSYGGNGRKQTFTDYSLGVTYARTISGDSGGAWKGWKPLATATPPQVRNLTLQSGFTADYTCTFFVTQESAVFLAGGVSGTLSANLGTQIGTLPADACPPAIRRRPAVTNNGPAYIDIHTDGTVWAYPFTAASECWFDCSFVAGGGS